LFYLAPIGLAVEPATQPASFLRCIDNGPQGGELDTADVAYVNDAGVSVHLIAAVHIADTSYYQRLSAEFDGYDAVLYELIKPRNAAAPGGNGAGEKSNNLISKFQRFLKNSLNLDYQLDAIDYTKANFIHADLDSETFEKMQAERGESMWTLLMKQMSDEWSNPAASGPDESVDEQARDAIQFLCRPDGERRLKMSIAHQMEQVEAVAAGLSGPNGTVILSERDKAAVAVLQKTILEGKRKIAIFYGAAHMPDISRRIEELGFRPVGVEWHEAWDITYRADAPSNVERALNGIIDGIEK
jgi:hypothetical protein